MEFWAFSVIIIIIFLRAARRIYASMESDEEKDTDTNKKA